MKEARYGGLFPLLLLAAFPGASGVAPASADDSATPGTRPNIVVVMADDK